MVLSLNKIKELIDQSSLVKNPKISFLGEGYNNYNYLIEENNERFVFRIKKNNEDQFNDSLEREYVFLKFFESQGINFCPKVVYYNKDENFQLKNL